MHNVPVTLSTLLKLEVLHRSGATVVCTLPVFVDSDPKAVQLLKKTGMKLIEQQKDLRGMECDVVLDCCAELASYLSPRLGAVELTQTG